MGPICSTQPNPPNDQPNPYQRENLNPGPNPTHDATDPIKTTTNLSVQERQLTGAEKKLEMRRTTNSRNNLMLTFARFAYLRHGYQCPLYIGGFDEFSAYKDLQFLCFCRFGPTTQPNPPKIKQSWPNPIQPNPWVDPTHGQLCTDLLNFLPKWTLLKQTSQSQSIRQVPARRQVLQPSEWLNKFQMWRTDEQTRARTGKKKVIAIA